VRAAAIMQLNHTNDPSARSWLDSANQPGCDFSIQNLPFGVFRRRGSGEAFRGSVAIGTHLIDLAALSGSAPWAVWLLKPPRLRLNPHSTACCLWVRPRGAHCVTRCSTRSEPAPPVRARTRCASAWYRKAPSSTACPRAGPVGSEQGRRPAAHPTWQAHAERLRGAIQQDLPHRGARLLRVR